MQLGALPFRTEPDGLQVLLATSRETKRWVIPKGWPMKKRRPHEAAAREAFEEAGLVGDIDETAIGFYEYDKRLKDGATVLCRVDVYPMRVTEQRRRWPEYEQRETRWFAPAEAAASVQEAELAALITNLEALLGRDITVAAGRPREAEAARAPRHKSRKRRPS